MEQKITILDTMIISCAGKTPKEAFETILNKKCMFSKSEHLPFGEDFLYVADTKTDAVSEFLSSDILKKANSLSANIFACVGEQAKDTLTAKQTTSTNSDISFFESDIEAVSVAVETISQNKNKAILVVGAGYIDFEQIKILSGYGKYSYTVCKPYDIESDGINSSNSVCAVLLCADSGEYELNAVTIAKTPTESIGETLKKSALEINSIGFIEGGSNASVAADRDEVGAIAEIFGQSVTLTSSKGALGYSTKNSFLEGICIAIEGLREGIIHSDTGLEHGFSIEATLAYGSKFRDISTALVNGYDDNSGKWCSTIVSKM